MKRIGPRCEPCGRPKERAAGVDCMIVDRDRLCSLSKIAVKHCKWCACDAIVV